MRQWSGLQWHLINIYVNYHQSFPQNHNDDSTLLTTNSENIFYFFPQQISLITIFPVLTMPDDFQLHQQLFVGGMSTCSWEFLNFFSFSVLNFYLQCSYKKNARFIKQKMNFFSPSMILDSSLLNLLLINSKIIKLIIMGYFGKAS